MVELELNQTTRLEPVDAQNKDQVAIVRGPQVLFAIANQQPTIAATTPQLKKADGQDWMLATSGGQLRLRPFAFIGDETYQTYLRTMA